MVRPGKKFVESKAMPLSEIFEKNGIKRVNLMKMDIEGSEYPVFYNSPDSVFKKIDKIYMEYHDEDTDKRNHQTLSKFLEKKGFDVNIKGPILYAFKKGLD